MQKNYTIKLIILLTLILSFGRSVSAASLSFVLDKSNPAEGQIFTTTIILNTEGASINTVEGDIKYNKMLVEAQAIDTGKSFVNFWVESPDLKTPGDIHFSGVTPGGVSTNAGVVFKVLFRAKNVGQTNITLANLNLFLNDGKGTPTSAKFQNAKIDIGKSVSINQENVVFNDNISPEKFSITRAQDPAIFDNKYFIVFSTTDKGSGVDHYEVCELFQCHQASSPFLLSNQTSFYRITVTAYDMNGNSISSTIVSVWFIASIVFLLMVLFVIIYLCV